MGSIAGTENPVVAWKQIMGSIAGTQNPDVAWETDFFPSIFGAYKICTNGCIGSAVRCRKMMPKKKAITHARTRTHTHTGQAYHSLGRTWWTYDTLSSTRAQILGHGSFRHHFLLPVIGAVAAPTAGCGCVSGNARAPAGAGAGMGGEAPTAAATSGIEKAMLMLPDCWSAPLLSGLDGLLLHATAVAPRTYQPP